MKIVSKFKDYYDSGQGYGIDESLVYVRKKKEFLQEQGEIAEHGVVAPVNASFGNHTGFKGDNPIRRNANLVNSWTTGTISFCGKVYRFICVEHFSGKSKYMLGEQVREYEEEYFYDYDSFAKFLKNFPDQADDFERELNPKQASKSRWFIPKRHHDPRAFSEESLKKNLGFVRDEVEFHQELGVPVILFTFEGREQYSYYGRNHWRQRFNKVVANPCLADYQFYKVFDPFTAFQEISMFIGGVLPREAPEMANISDEDMRDAKGFDDWSFKTLPTKKR